MTRLPKAAVHTTASELERHQRLVKVLEAIDILGKIEPNPRPVFGTYVHLDTGLPYSYALEFVRRASAETQADHFARTLRRARELAAAELDQLSRP